MLPLNVLDELVRPVTLAARLFFNIFVGELLFIIIASIIVAKVSVGPVNLSLAVSVFPFGIQIFNFFVGTIQAFVFTLLGIVYLSLALAEEHWSLRKVHRDSESFVAAAVHHRRSAIIFQRCLRLGRSATVSSRRRPSRRSRVSPKPVPTSSPSSSSASACWKRSRSLAIGFAFYLLLGRRARAQPVAHAAK